ncbi:MAG: ligase-associated DNA damage response endonuclease PdeM [Pseudomonadota bacterium]|nr:ligase-associated DNA damage response endonuclease PdeM [Pseudomonadota bacterium]
MIAGATAIVVAGERLLLLPQWAAFWPNEQLLLIADLHLGKPHTFQREGLAVPQSTMTGDLNRLTYLVMETGAKRLLILGDFVHHRHGLTHTVRTQVETWIASLRPLEIMVVVGNHDRPSLPFIASLPVTTVGECWEAGPFRFVHDNHYPTGAEPRFTWSGHLHPVLKIESHLRRHVPAFVFTEKQAVLPAFSLFTGGLPVKAREYCSIFATADDQVIRLK